MTGAIGSSFPESEGDLADFFENAAIPLHWVGANGIVLRANRAELEFLGYSAEEYVGRNIADFHADSDVICGILDRLTRGDTLRDEPARMRAGSSRSVSPRVRRARMPRLASLSAWKSAMLWPTYSSAE